MMNKYTTNEVLNTSLPVVAEVTKIFKTHWLYIYSSYISYLTKLITILSILV